MFKVNNKDTRTTPMAQVNEQVNDQKDANGADN